MRRTRSAVALSTAFIAAQAFAGVGASHAAPPNGCPYPPNNPILSANVSDSTVRSVEPFSVGGYLTQNGCGIGGRRVGLFAREPGTTDYVYQNQTVTGLTGQYGFRYATDETLELIVIFSGDRVFPRTVSAPRTVTVTR